MGSVLGRNTSHVDVERYKHVSGKEEIERIEV